MNRNTEESGRPDEAAAGNWHDDELPESEGPLLDPRTAAGSHVTAATVLAGFCLTAIVVISNSPDTRHGAFDRAVGALLTAFLCLVLSGFLEALVGAQLRRSRRTFLIALLSGVAIATSSLFALWGLCEVIDVVFRYSDLNELTGWVFVWGAVTITAFVVHLGINVRRAAGADGPGWSGIAAGQIALAGLALGAGALLGIDDQSSLDVIVALQLGGITMGLIGSLVVIGRANGTGGGRELNILLTYVLTSLPTGVAMALLARLTNNPLW